VLFRRLSATAARDLKSPAVASLCAAEETNLRNADGTVSMRVIAIRGIFGEDFAECGSDRARVALFSNQLDPVTFAEPGSGIRSRDYK